MVDREAVVSPRDELLSGLCTLSENQIRMVGSVVRALREPVEFLEEPGSDLVHGLFAETMANFLTLHHALHEEAFSKKPFEYVLKQCMLAQGHQARLNPNPGDLAYDLEGAGFRWSLKTEAAKGISASTVKIEKLMEARWVRDCLSPERCAEEVRVRLPHHMAGYDRILVLRAFDRPGFIAYKLEEVPKAILVSCFTAAEPEMFEKAGKARKALSFGADFYLDGEGKRAFRILLDSSVEKVRLWYGTSFCRHHGTWIVPKTERRSIELYTSAS